MVILLPRGVSCVIWKSSVFHPCSLRSFLFLIGTSCSVFQGTGLIAADEGVPDSPRLVELQQQLRRVPSRVVGSPEPPPPYRAERVWPELTVSLPIGAAIEPGSRRLLFVAQEPDRLCRTSDDPVGGAYETLFEFSQGGVGYSIEFHPQFQQNGYVYIGWNGFLSREQREGEQKQSIVTRYTIDRQAPYALDVDSALDIIWWESNGHNGAALAFGPDGMLYVTSGDGTSDSDDNLTGQRLDLLLAKVLRIDVDHPDPGRAYSVPKDNPFVGQEGIRSETWAYGFRNPWRMTIDQQTGHVWVGNNGQDLWEQIYLVKKGANYGWSVYEGRQIFYAERELGPHPVSEPIFDHPHSEARSMTGGVVYRGRKLPDLYGAYVYGDYSTGKIWGAKLDGDEVIWHAELADTTLAIAGFALDADGELLIVDHQRRSGGFYTLVPEDRPFDPAAFPRKLSDTGLFENVPQHRLHAGAIPYSVNAPLWSDGAEKERFLILPETDEPIGFHPTASWDFPDRTVAVKSFSFELEEGNPDSRRWVETRLLTRQAGEWIGYSYHWNDEQTDATLVEKAGADRTFKIRRTDGTVREQQWRYPSRTECMVCHSRAAKFVLGLSTLQLNREHDYGDIRSNQLEVFRSFGMLPQAKAADEYQRLVDPADDSQELSVRVRSYLHANCAQCHVWAGGGNSQFDLSFLKSLDETKLIDERPLHHTYGIEEARLVAPGEPERSILLNRIARRGPGQMPQLATSLVDEQAVAIIEQWIRELAADRQTTRDD